MTSTNWNQWENLTDNFLSNILIQFHLLKYVRPCHDNAGRNPNRNKDNIYGDKPLAQIDRRTDAHGDQRAEVFMILQALKEASYSESVPTSRSDTRKSSEWDHWHAAEVSEMKSHEQNGTWVLVPRPMNRKIVKNRWVYA